MEKFNKFVCLFVVALMFCACSVERARDEVVREVEDVKMKLPMRFWNTTVTSESVDVVDVYIENDYVVIVAEPVNYRELMLGYARLAYLAEKSDKDVARMFNNIGQDRIDKLIEAELGFRYIYRCEQDDELMTIEADYDRLKRIKAGIASGDIVPYTALEIFHMEQLNGYDLPFEIEDGMWIVDGYIEENRMYYIIALESHIASEDISDSDIQQFKEYIIGDLKEKLVGAIKKEMVEKNIEIIYAYINSFGDEIFNVEITADDL